LQENAKCDKTRQISQNNNEKQRSNRFNIFIWFLCRKTRFRIFFAKRKSREKNQGRKAALSNKK